MRKVLGLAVGAAMMAAAPVQAAEWWYVTSTSGDDVLFIDAQSIKRVGAKRIFWSKLVNKYAQNKVKSDVVRSSIDCDRETISNIAWIEHSETGGVIDSRTVDSPKEQPIAPDTIAVSMMQFACAEPSQWGQSLGAVQIGVTTAEYAENYQRTQELLRGSKQ